MPVTPVNPVTGATTAAETQAANPLQRPEDLGREDFLRLLLVQLQNQNPLEPIGDTEFIAQLSQFSTVESLQQLNRNFQDLLLVQGLAQGTNLIGKTIVFQPIGSDSLLRGVVDSVAVDNGQILLLVGGAPVLLEEVRGVEAAPLPNP